jgi:hypothetical protein
MNGSKPNAYMICKLLWQSNVPNIKGILAERKKCRKLKIRDIFQSPRAITYGKINGSQPNSNLICIMIWKSNAPNIK